MTHATVPAPQPAPSAPAPKVVGPGWYDSSWDLRRGLQVEEVDEAACAAAYAPAGGAEAEPPSAT